MSASGVVFDIKRYALHDGPGLRATVHLKGCPLSCWWCHNPEGIVMTPSVLFRPERCISCGACADSCREGALLFSGGAPFVDPILCTGCGACGELCPAAALERCGHEMEVGELIAELRKDELFFRDGGGVTFSGGEPLMQPEFMMESLSACGEEGWHRVVDTSGFVPEEVLLAAARNTELFLYDIKHMDSQKHRLYTGVGNEVILENLVRLAESGARINLRFPFLPGINGGDANVTALASFAAGLSGITAVNLLPYHPAAKGKHHRWGIEYKLPDLPPPTEHQLRHAAAIVEGYGLAVRIGG